MRNSEMPKFSNILKDLMNEFNYDPKKLSDEINVQLSIIYKWLRNERIPSVNNFIKLSNCFKCSIDYLIGKTDDFGYIKIVAKQKFSSILKTLINNKQIPITKLSKETEIASSLIYDWLNEVNEPKINNIIKIADYFGYTINELLNFK